MGVTHVDKFSASEIKNGFQELTGDGAITIKSGVCILNKAGAIAATLADPIAGDDDSKELLILSITAQTHSISNAAGSGFNGGGAASDVGTMTAAIGNLLRVVARAGKWYVTQNINVTLA